MTIPSDEFTILDANEAPTESAIELGRAGNDVGSDAANTSESSEGFEPIPTPITRRHFFPNYFPILTLLRYLSVSYATEFVTAEFETHAIRHTAVSPKFFIDDVIILYPSWCI